MKRRWRILLPLLLVAGLSSYWLAGTESGNRRLLSWALGDAVAFSSYRGSLFSEIELTEIHYRDADQQLSARRLWLRWRPAALLDGVLHLNALEAAGVSYQAITTGETSAAAPPPLPLALRLDRLLLEDLEYQTSDTHLHIPHIRGRLLAEGHTVRLEELSVHHQAFSLEAEGRIELDSRFPLDLRVSWQGEWPELGPLAGTGTLKGNLDGLDIEHRATTPFELATTGHVDLSQSPPLLALEGTWQQLRWPLVEPAWLESPGGQYRLSGPATQPHLEAAADTLLLPRTPPLTTASLAGRIDAAGLSEARLEAKLPEGEIALLGSLAWTPKLGWDLEVSGRALNPAIQWPQWPGRLNLTSRLRGGLTETGLWLEADIAQLDGRLRDQPFSARAKGGVQDDTLTLHRATIELPPLVGTPGQLQLQGTVRWTPELLWDLELNGQALNPAIAWTEWPGRLDLISRLHGGLAETGLWLEADIEKLAGLLRDQPFTAAGQGGMRNGIVTVEQAAIDSGPNRLRLRGAIGEVLDIALALDAPDLGASWPALAGRLQADGRIGGTPAQPTIAARLAGAGLHYGGDQIERLRGELNWTAEQAQGKFEAEDITFDGWQGRHLALSLTGTPRHHQAELRLAAAEGELHSRVHGGWEEGRWDGSIEQISLQHPQAGPWATLAPAALRVQPAQGSLEELCLGQDQSRLCLKANWDQTHQRIDAALSALPLARLVTRLTEQARIEGLLDGRLQLDGPRGSLHGFAQLQLNGAAASVDIEGAEPLRLEILAGSSTLRAGPAGITADIAMRLSHEGSLSGNLSLSPTGADEARTLSGNLSATLPDLMPLQIFIPGLTELRGQLSGDVQLGGDTRRPQFQGELRLSQGSARLPRLGLELADIGLSAYNRGTEELVLSGSIESGGGRLQLAGTAILDAERGWPLELDLQGEDIQIARLPELQAWASPDLKLTLANRRLGIRGTITVPRADIQIREPPKGAVTVSDDERIVGMDMPGQPEPELPAIDADIALRLGEAVRFSGFGLDSQLGGALALHSGAARYQANGELRLTQGRYKAYGQDLAIEQGRFLFAGPADNPGLDIRATRQSVDQRVTAVLNVGGSLHTPLVTVSSRPALPEEEALSYLVTGHGLGDTGGGKAAMLRQAALSQGLDKSQAILDQIALGIGADEMKVQEGATLEDTALLLGKYLSPDLYVSYALGLFDQQGGLLMRYRLGERLRLEVQSGAQSSADLIYDFEKE